jgi:putative phosphoribosyl transferase
MFLDRADGGQKLVKRLSQYANRDDVVVLGIPRGGVPVAFEVAQALKAPLDIMLVRKLGTPGQAELAMGAIASGGVRILNQEVIRELGISDEQLEAATAAQKVELERRERLFRGTRPPISVQGKVVILIDDGIATGSSMLAAIDALRALQPAKIVVATPVAPANMPDRMKGRADEFICAQLPEWFFAIGEFYQNFPQTEDSEVRDFLTRADEARAKDKSPRAPEAA